MTYHNGKIPFLCSHFLDLINETITSNEGVVIETTAQDASEAQCNFLVQILIFELKIYMQKTLNLAG